MDGAKTTHIRKSVNVRGTAEDPDRFLRRKAVSDLLGISRHTLRRIIEGDPTFPRFVEISPGIQVVRERAVRRWVATKELAARDATR